MAEFVIRNKRTGVTMGEVFADTAEDALNQLARDTGSSIEDIAVSLGRNAKEAAEAIDIVEIDDAEPAAKPKGAKVKKWGDPYPNLPRRWVA